MGYQYDSNKKPNPNNNKKHETQSLFYEYHTSFTKGPL